MRAALVLAALLASLVACRDDAVQDPGFDDVESTLSSIEADVDAP
ncbi:hypothetical protein [Saccharothrix variisporea]|uniref:Uncharacterized protein n=1 Tax=Saccharothrix variisporea TaxID=543527 RepID=A0A495X3F3_9PSEU|nr:hypothetical protein [Saccharothrix variisporea]RKT68751.1 hypothetical protein DFJ66_1944 [Saccharothrix variisporea]